MVGQKIAHENVKKSYRTKMVQTDKVELKGNALDDFAQIGVLDSQASGLDFQKLQMDMPEYKSNILGFRDYLRLVDSMPSHSTC